MRLNGWTSDVFLLQVRIICILCFTKECIKTVLCVFLYSQFILELAFVSQPYYHTDFAFEKQDAVKVIQCFMGNYCCILGS